MRKQLKKMNNSSRYKELRANLRPDGCPHCGYSKLIGWGVYWRKVKYFFSMRCGKKPCKRYRCRLCKATFSTSPQSLSPFRRYSNKALIDFEADTLEKAEELLDSALKRIDDFIGTKVEPVLNMLSKNRDRLFPFLKYGLNRTNNPVEHHYGFVKRFQHVSKKFYTLEGIRNLFF